jgi:hypothetical protein
MAYGSDVRRRWARTFPAAACAVVAVAGLTGCGGAGTAAPEAAATSFARAAAAGDGAAGCRILSPSVAEEVARSAGTSCADALRGSPPPGAASVRDARRYGRQAVVVTAGDTIFLSEFPDGWKVIAAGCTRQPGDEPYDCTVSGG